MSIRDIIEAAITTREAVRLGTDRGTEGADRRAAAWAAKEKFQDTFDPEHVALMEAVCEAAERDDDGRFGGRSLHYCIADLTAFRKERGL